MKEVEDVSLIINYLGYKLESCTRMPVLKCAKTKYFDYELRFSRRKENGLRDNLRMVLNTSKPIDKEVDLIFRSQN